MGKLRKPGFPKDPEFQLLYAGFHCDVFVFARHEGGNIERGWSFYVLPESVVRDAVSERTTFTFARLEYDLLNLQWWSSSRRSLTRRRSHSD